MRFWWARGHQWLPESYGACLYLSCCGWDGNCAETGLLKTQLSSPKLTFACCPWGHRGLGGVPQLPIPACPWLCVVTVGPGWSASSRDWLTPLTADPRPLLEQLPHTWVIGVVGMNTHCSMCNGWTIYTCTQGGAQRWGAVVAVNSVDGGWVQSQPYWCSQAQPGEHPTVR